MERKLWKEQDSRKRSWKTERWWIVLALSAFLLGRAIWRVV
jgi:hypothetical protein